MTPIVASGQEHLRFTTQDKEARIANETRKREVMSLIGKPNVYFDLPVVRAIKVKPPGEEREHFATLISQDNDFAKANFPQCPIDGRGPYQDMETVNVPISWLEVPESQEPRPLDTTANPEIRKSFQEFLAVAGGYHVKLVNSEWEAVGPSTDRYNCIANSLGVKDEWIFPSFEKEPYLKKYQEQGYLPLGEMDYRHQPGLEKVVLFGVGPSDRGYNAAIRGAISLGMGDTDKSLLITHATRQEDEGVYTSKMGAYELIATVSPDDVAGESYGRPLVVMARTTQK
jgi:hypothetical protein